jgi:hypothetical protein
VLNRDTADGGRIAERLQRFSELVAADSPLYGRICAELADDPTINQILSRASFEQPVGPIVLAAVQFLLLQGADPALAAHYPSIGGDIPPVGDPVELFRSFCDEHLDTLSNLVATRTVQTNEVRRCTALMPAFSWVAQQAESPLSLIEIGPSAGLNLLFDRYRYDYGAAGATGPASSPLALTTDLRGGRLPPIDPLPLVDWRRGIDLNPIEVMDDAAVLWARSMLWPEQTDRVERFITAVEVARRDPPRLLQGDAIEMLAAVARDAPNSTTLVIFHSLVLNQLSAIARTALTTIIEAIAQFRPVHRIGIDMVTTDSQPLTVLHTSYESATTSETALAHTTHHGAWLEWLA